ncbi:hypothetical protein TWF506_001530 [Arthrobotrys conoides]|uniref:Uncharacterized protein n=1 Tax=Arthrobotrys conoides TaxID=74498 RepID=A0AAN8P297_9PEZI
MSMVPGSGMTLRSRRKQTLKGILDTTMRYGWTGICRCKIFFPCSVLTNLEEFASYQEAQTEEALEAAASSEGGERRRQLAKLWWAQGRRRV